MVNTYVERLYQPSIDHWPCYILFSLSLISVLLQPYHRVYVSMRFPFSVICQPTLQAKSTARRHNTDKSSPMWLPRPSNNRYQPQQHAILSEQSHYQLTVSCLVLVLFSLAWVCQVSVLFLDMVITVTLSRMFVSWSQGEVWLQYWLQDGCRPSCRRVLQPPCRFLVGLKYKMERERKNRGKIPRLKTAWRCCVILLMPLFVWSWLISLISTWVYRERERD